MGKWQTSTGLVRTLTVPSHGPVQFSLGYWLLFDQLETMVNLVAPQTTKQPYLNEQCRPLELRNGLKKVV